MSDILPAQVWSEARVARSIFQYIRYQHIGLFTAVFDFALILAASVFAGVFYHQIVFDTEGELVAYLAVGCYAGFIFVLLSKLLGLYQPNALLSAHRQLRGALISWIAVVLFITSLFFVLKTGAHYSRGAIIGFSICGLMVIVGFRAIIGVGLKQALADGTIAGRKVIILGDSEELAANSSLHLLRSYGAKEVGRFELSPTLTPTTLSTKDIAALDSSVAAAQVNRAEQVLLAVRWGDRIRREQICQRLHALPLSVLLLPDQSVNAVFDNTARDRRAVPAIEVQRAPLSPQDLLLKRCLDIFVASFCLLALSPLLMLVTAAIKLSSPGPVIFRQRRKGFNGRDFVIYKFRTMTCMEDGTCIRQAQRNDSRVTPLGRLLRASSIDELPQLINVLAGQMSLVGPRPHAVAHHEEYCNSVDNYAFRHHVKPGISGWAQTHGFRGETADAETMKKRIQLDLWYINNWSFLLDLRILGQTVVEILRPRNAY